MDLKLNTGAQVACAWASVICVGFLLVGFFIISGYVPPPHANWSAQHLAHFYRDHADRLHVGLMITMWAWGGYGAMTAVVTMQMIRLEGRRPILALLQLCSGVAGWACLLVPTMLLAAASFRPERSPELTQSMHDMAWIVAFFATTPFMVQAFAFGAAVLRDPRETPVYPRWLGFFSLWSGVLFAPGALLIYFKHGAFAYHGLFVFWVPFVVFGLWILALSWWSRVAALEEAAQDEAVATG